MQKAWHFFTDTYSLLWISTRYGTHYSGVTIHSITLSLFCHLSVAEGGLVNPRHWPWICNLSSRIWIISNLFAVSLSVIIQGLAPFICYWGTDSPYHVTFRGWPLSQLQCPPGRAWTPACAANSWAERTTIIDNRAVLWIRIMPDPNISRLAGSDPVELLGSYRIRPNWRKKL